MAQSYIVRVPEEDIAAFAEFLDARQYCHEMYETLTFDVMLPQLLRNIRYSRRHEKEDLALTIVGHFIEGYCRHSWYRHPEQATEYSHFVFINCMDYMELCGWRGIPMVADVGDII